MIEKILNECVLYYNQNIISDNIYYDIPMSGWIIRNKNWNLAEDMIIHILETICFELWIINYDISWKKKDYIRVNSENWYINTSTDIHFKLNGLELLFIECKTYLDKCYLDRANSDLSHLKKSFNESYCFIISLEKATPDNVEYFFMDQWFIDGIYYLLDGIRSSKKPIWKSEFKKEINKDKLSLLISDLLTIITQHM